MRLVLLLLIWMAPLLADSSKQSLVLIPAHQVYEGDFFGLGRNIEISGTVNGDVYLIGGSILIDGVVNGSVLAIGARINISGTVTKSCRVVARETWISGHVEDSISSVGGALLMLPNAVLRGNLVAVDMNVDMAAPIEGNVTAIAGDMKVSSHVQGNINGYVGKMRLTSKAIVDGYVDYRSSSPAIIEQGAVIKGKLIYHDSVTHKLMDRSWLHQLLIGSQIVVFLMNFIYTLASAYLLNRFFATSLIGSVRVLGVTPWRSLLCGALVVVVMPVLILSLLVSVLGVPLALAVMGFNILGFYTAKVYVIFWATDWSIKRWHWRHRGWIFVLLTMVYFALAELTFFGTTISVVCAFLGLGCVSLYQLAKIKSS